MMKFILLFVLCATVYSNTKPKLPSKALFVQRIKAYPHGQNKSQCIAEVKEHRGLSQQKSELECNDFYNLLDKNNDDFLDKKELKRFLKLMNLYRLVEFTILNTKWKAFFADGTLTRSEFINQAENYSVMGVDSQVLADDLFTADQNGDGVLEERDVVAIWENLKGYVEEE